MTVPAIVLLLMFVYLRLHQIIEPLGRLPILPMLFMAVLACFVIDALGKRLEVRAAAPLWWAAALLGWVALGGLRVGTGVDPVATFMMVILVMTLYGVIAGGLQDFSRLTTVALCVVGINLVLAFVGAHQSVAPRGCIALAIEDGRFSTGEGRPDGRSCSERAQCYDDLAEPDHEYLCERVGLAGTSSIQNRVRYRGILQDPNELAFTLAASLPFLILLVGRFGFASRSLTLLSGLLVIMWCVVATQSRSGQLANLAVLGVYFLRRYGWRGILISVALTLPLLLLGGRAGNKADASTLDRYEAWRAGLELLQTNPIMGVGPSMFTEYHHLTAHNSFLLIAAELGMIGLIGWVLLWYVCIKTARKAMQRTDDRAVSSWGTAVFASLIGCLIPSMFLSLSYHFILWIHLGIASALYGATCRRLPDFRVRVGFADVALCTMISFAFIVAVYVMLTLKGY